MTPQRNEGPGTSFATPTVSGIIALILEANPNLGWRDVQAIIALTSNITDANDDSWAVNDAGLHHSNKYGFGIINAHKAVLEAKDWTNLGPEQNITIESEVISLPIQNDPSATTTSTLNVEAPGNIEMESVVVYLVSVWEL